MANDNPLLFGGTVSYGSVLIFALDEQIHDRFVLLLQECNFVRYFHFHNQDSDVNQQALISCRRQSDIQQRREAPSLADRVNVHKVKNMLQDGLLS